MKASTELRDWPGVGPKRADKLAEAGFVTLEDLFYHLPFRYEDRRTFAKVGALAPDGEKATLEVTVADSRLIRTRRRGFTIFEAHVEDDSGRLKVVWFNQPYLKRVMTAGRVVVLYGGRVKVERGGARKLEAPEYEILESGDGEGIHTGRVVPVYRKLGELAPRTLRRLLHEALSRVDPETIAPLVPEDTSRRHGLLPRGRALRDTHFPPDDVELEALEARGSLAQRSLAFEEVFLLQLALAGRRAGREARGRVRRYEIDAGLKRRLAGVLPFRLTAAQRRVLREIADDLGSETPMNRLLQGDVGSGKTAVALLTLLIAIANGYQGALMAPTEILAEQHFRGLTDLLERAGHPCRTVLLTGSLRAAARRRALESIRSGHADLVVGTHALFEGGVEFRRLALAVVDEQHRFGVLQRAALAAKGEEPDVLVMTATPIPRSLSLTLYGDLELSVIDELPPGRTPIRTVVRGEEDRDRVYAGLRREIEAGRQAYVVVPLVEQSERSDLKAATEVREHLAGVFADRRVGLVHGKMKGPEKDEVMQGFARGAVDLLVATTVVEVGVDVANASVMVVEHAERFGLSQLHQLRGRVGRGAARSYCVLMAGAATGAEARERLAIMESTTDGFVIAQRDLELRGPGVVFGTQQHGLGDLQFLAEILRTPDLVDTARDEARLWHRRESDAGRDPLAPLSRRWRHRLGLARVG